jgi:AraC family transcriptional regulator
LKKQEDDIERIGKAVRYIEKNIDQNLILEDIAKIAHYSPFHFQRIFKHVVGESPKQYVIRLRLEAAAHYIVLKPDDSILKTAIDSGFNSLESFSRAFKDYYSISPDGFRKMSEEEKLMTIQNKTHIKNTSFDPTSFLASSINENDFDDLSVKVVRLPVSKLIYIPTTLESTDTIIGAFNKLKQWAEARELFNKHGKPFGLMRDYPMFTALDKCRYLCCLPVGNIVEVSGDVNYMELPAKAYATFEVHGSIDNLLKKITIFYNHWLPNSGFELVHDLVIHTPVDDLFSIPFDENTYRIYIVIQPK